MSTMAGAGRTCPNCGNETGEAREFCPHCGAIIADESELEKESGPEAVRIAEAMAPPPITLETVPPPSRAPISARISAWFRNRHHA